MQIQTAAQITVCALMTLAGAYAGQAYGEHDGREKLWAVALAHKQAHFDPLTGEKVFGRYDPDPVAQMALRLESEGIRVSEDALDEGKKKIVSDSVTKNDGSVTKTKKIGKVLKK